MQLNTQKILRGVHTGTRTELQVLKGGVTDDAIKQASGISESVFSDHLAACENPSQVRQLEHAFLLAVKTVQESLNNRGQALFDKDSYYTSINPEKYPPLDDGGHKHLDMFLSDGQLENLKLACFHTWVSPLDPDRKYSFFGGTCYTDTADALCKTIQQCADIRIGELIRLQAQPKLYKIGDLKAHHTKELVRRLQLPHTAKAIQKFALNNGNPVRAGKIQIKRLDPLNVLVTVLDNDRSYILNQTWGTHKLIKPNNFDIALTNDQLEALERGEIQNYAHVYHFASNARLKTAGINVDKNIYGDFVTSPGGDVITAEMVQRFKFERINRQPSPASLAKDGFYPRIILDRNEKEKILYVTPNQGDDLLTAIRYGGWRPRTKEACMAFIKKFASTVFQKAKGERVYDVKLENILLDQHDNPQLIDTVNPDVTYTHMLPETKAKFEKRQQFYLKQGYDDYNARKGAAEDMQVPLLKDAVLITMLKLGNLLQVKHQEIINYMKSSEFRDSTHFEGQEAEAFQKYIVDNEGTLPLMAAKKLQPPVEKKLY